jgi:hypothetical protein
MPYKITEDKEKKEIYIDLDPGNNEHRVSQGAGNGFMGKESIVQMDIDPIIGTVSGIRIRFEVGRDDSSYNISH